MHIIPDPLVNEMHMTHAVYPSLCWEGQPLRKQCEEDNLMIIKNVLMIFFPNDPCHIGKYTLVAGVDFSYN